MQQIGIGQATSVKKLEIVWPGCKHVQTIENIKGDQQIHITEGNNKYVVKKYKTFDFKLSPNQGMQHMMMPGMSH
jgi:hypothetical protein